MPASDERPDTEPRAEPGRLSGLGFALLVHLLLAAALTWGVNWKNKASPVAFEAELWSEQPQEAAPPPPPPPPPEPPTPAVVTPPAPPQALPNADIALERDKRRKLKETEGKKKALTAKEQKAEKARLAKEAAKAKLEAQKAEAEKAQEAQEAQEARRYKESMDRMNAQLGATGAATSKGSAAQSSGPSASYGGKVRAKVKPNIIFTEDIAGNPVAEVEVRTTLDGSITSQRLIKSSGNKAWDDAVIKAIIRTETLPRDVDGRVPTPLIIEFRPKD